MDKRYQVFISSTFTDLQEERMAVLKAILEVGQMPAGMELFPPTDETAWQLIRDVIDASDYYVLILGGRYGSTDCKGLGYTEKEYDYASEKRKHVIPILHKAPGELPRERTETDPEAWKKYENFRRKVESHHTCSYWNSKEQLESRVIVGLTSAMKHHPTVGWVRANQVPSHATVTEVLNLRNRITELETEITSIHTKPPIGTEDLSQGDEGHTVHLELSNDDEIWKKQTVHLTWNELFAGVAPTLLSEVTLNTLIGDLDLLVERYARVMFSDLAPLEVNVSHSDLETCIVQFRALGLICESDRQRPAKDGQVYWKLTPYGDHLMQRLRAVRRKNHS